MTPIKEELPLSSELEIADVVQQFEHCTLPYIHWTHRAHLAVAVFYSRQVEFEDALTRIRKNIYLYNNTCGDPVGYNETITITFLRKIYSELKQGHHCQSLHDEVARLSEFCTVEWLYEYFSKELIWSEKAKDHWVPPDISELDF